MFPISDLRPPTSEIRSPISDIRPPTSDIRHPTSDIRHPTSEIRNPKSDIRHPKSEIRNPKSDILHPTHFPPCTITIVKWPAGMLGFKKAAYFGVAYAVNPGGACVPEAIIPIRVIAFWAVLSIDEAIKHFIRAILPLSFFSNEIYTSSRFDLYTTWVPEVFSTFV